MYQGRGAERVEQEGEGAAGVQGTESSSNWSKPITHSLAPLSLAGSRGLFWEALHTACHFPAKLTGSKTKPAQQQPYVNRVGGEEALNRTAGTGESWRSLGEHSHSHLEKRILQGEKKSKQKLS